MVNTEFFASFEHDIILNRNWFPTVMKHLQDDPQVAVAQGVRVTTNPVFKKIEEVCLERNIPYTSIDNNIYRTDLIKKLGGFDFRFPISCDRNLKERVTQAGYKWVSDKTVVSDHIRGGIRQSAKHFYELSKLDDPNNPSITPILLRFLFSPIRGLEISIKKRVPTSSGGLSLLAFHTSEISTENGPQTKTTSMKNMMKLNSFFESKVEIPRIKVGKKQIIETLITEEALLFANYARKEKQQWTPRIVNLS